MMFFKWIWDWFFKTLILLDSDVRRDVFIGVTGLVVAIVIFIAEYVSNKDKDIDLLKKRVMLHSTHVKGNTMFILFVFVFMLFCSLFKLDCEFAFISWNDYIYIFLQLCLNISIAIVFCITAKMFIVAIKLIIERDYYEKKVDSYIYSKVLKLEKMTDKKIDSNLSVNKNIFNDFIETQTIYFVYDNFVLGNNFFNFFDDEYVPVYSPKNGIIKGYNYDKLRDLVSLYQEHIFKDINYEINDNPVVFFMKDIGDKVNKSMPVFYYLRQYEQIFKNLSDYIIYSDNRLYLTDEVNQIHISLFELALGFSEYESFDEDNRIYNYFDYLYKNNLSGIKSLALNYIDVIGRKVKNDYLLNSKLCLFLNRLSYLAYQNNMIEDYEYILEKESVLYKNQLFIPGIDSRDVAFNYALHSFKYNFYFSKKIEDIKYYDILLASLFKMISTLMKKNMFEASLIMLNNITIDSVNSSDDDLDAYEVLKFQFVCGFVYCLYMMIEKNKLTNDDKKYVSQIIEYLGRGFVNLYDVWKTTLYFKKYFNKNTAIQRVYDHFDFDFVEHKYKTFFSALHVDEKRILKLLFSLFDIDYFNKQDVDINIINKDDESFYKGLKELVLSDKKDKLEEYLDINYNSNDLLEMLDYVISITERLAIEYRQSNRLDENKRRKFKQIIKNQIKHKNTFLTYLESCKKVEYTDKKRKIAYGINKIVPRELFFKEVYGYENFAKNIGDMFNNGIKKEFISKLEKSANFCDVSLETKLKQIENFDEYVLVTNYLNCKYIYGYDRGKREVVFEDKKMDVIIISSAENVYLVLKSDLPKLQYCIFDDKWNKKFIDNNIYFEFSDLAKHEKLRKEIMMSSAWLKEKGDNNSQDNYLKEHCYIRIFLSFCFEDANSYVLKFEFKEK